MTTSVRRVEDERFLTGKGAFGDDFAAGALHACFVRSPHAHARITRIDVLQARRSPGVVTVATWHDLPPNLRGALPVLFAHPELTQPVTPPPLARDEVCFVGEPVAVVVASDRYQAEDAAELVQVSYELLKPVVGLTAAVAGRFPSCHLRLPTSVAGRVTEEVGDVTAALAQAPHRITRHFDVERSAGIPMEGRVVSAWPGEERLLVRDTTQSPSSIHAGLAQLLGLTPDRICVVAGDIGGSFGSKGVYFYPEELVVPWLAHCLDKPVIWTEDRAEHFVATAHERGQCHTVEVGFDDDGRILALDLRFVHDMGAYSQYGLIVPVVTASQLPGPYELTNYRYEFTASYTNTVPVAPYRGAGRPQGTFVVERILQTIANERGLDPTLVRRRNLVQPGSFPYPVGVTYQDGELIEYDSGNYQALFDALESKALPHLLADRDAARRGGRRAGVGIAACVEGTGLGPYESAEVSVSGNGEVTVSVALSSQGQGHETTLAQIAASRLNVPLSVVRVRGGDSRHVPASAGTYASRAAVMAGSAVAMAADRIACRAQQSAARCLGLPAHDLVLADGAVRARDDGSVHITLGELARLADPAGFDVGPDAARLAMFRSRLRRFPDATIDGCPALRELATFTSSKGAWGSGVHAALVEVDEATWRVQILRYVVVHDCGVMINPAIVKGQIVGGVCQGIGGALFERLDYDDMGRLRNANLDDFHLPQAADVPDVEVHHLSTPSTTNPLGVKGVGEAGVIPVAAAIANAVEDAIGVPIDEAPFPPAVLHALATTSVGGRQFQPLRPKGGTR